MDLSGPGIDVKLKERKKERKKTRKNRVDNYVVLKIIKQLVMISNHGSQNIRKSNNGLKIC